MNKFLDQIGDKLLPLANKLASNRYLAVLRDAFMLSFPLTMFGSIVVVFNNLPFFKFLHFFPPVFESVSIYKFSISYFLIFQFRIICFARFFCYLVFSSYSTMVIS